MKKILALIIFLGFIQSVSAQAPDWVWARGMGGSHNDVGRSIAVDIWGNTYVTGNFTDTVDFDPGPGVFNLISGTSGSNGGVFVTKFDSSGNLIWAKGMSGGGGRGMSLAIDDSGNVYITGVFSDTVDFDPGTDTFYLHAPGVSGFSDVFILKLNNSGDFVWAKSMGDNQNDNSYSIALDSSGNVYTTGGFQGTVDFDPGVDTFNIASVGNSDLFILKLSRAGNFLYAKTIAGSASVGGISLALDYNRNIYVTGSLTGGTADFDPGIGTYNLSSPTTGSLFVVKLDSSANLYWAEVFGNSSSTAGGGSIRLDSSDNILVMGGFSGVIDFDPGPSIYNLSVVQPYADGFILKLNNVGNFLWAKALFSTSPFNPTSIVLDKENNIYYGGSFLDFDFDLDSINTFNLFSTGGSDLFISKLDSNGNFFWVKSIGGNSADEIKAMSLGPNGNVFVTGSYKSSVIDFGSDVLVNQTSFYENLLIAKLSLCSPTLFTINIIECNSYTSPSGIYTWTTSGTYMDTISNAAGCDSVLTINLTINNSTASTENISACDSYISPSGNYTWTTSGTHMDTIPNAAGCDSVLTINLTINTVTASYTLYPDPDTTQLHHWFAIANVTGTSPIDYLWSWGDGATDIGATPSHTYSAAAFYAICLTVSDGAGCTTTYCDSSTFISKTEEERLIITINVVTQLPSGIAAVTATNNSISITPNPCTLCEITGAVTATDLMVQILGRNQHATFSKSANGYYIHLPATTTGIFLIRNIKTGEVVKFVWE